MLYCLLAGFVHCVSSLFIVCTQFHINHVVRCTQREQALEAVGLIVQLASGLKLVVHPKLYDVVAATSELRAWVDACDTWYHGKIAELCAQLRMPLL